MTDRDEGLPENDHPIPIRATVDLAYGRGGVVVCLLGPVHA
jgi:hypothetical protein